MRLLLAPGQGSQKPGFLIPWLENSEFRNLIEQFSEASETDLVFFGTRADESQIKDTAVAQPLIVAASIASARLMFDNSPNFDGVLGHSVGEFAAAALAGIISDTDALKLVGIRARAMASEAAKTKTGMVAAIGADLTALQQNLGDLEIANYNGANQYVLAGSSEALAQLVSEPLQGWRLIPLSVAGAFHTSYMAGAVPELAKAASEVTVSDPLLKIWTNFDGSEITSGTEFLQHMIHQVSRPVRWDKCMSSVSNASASYELLPSGVLQGLAKRQLANAENHSIREIQQALDWSAND